MIGEVGVAFGFFLSFLDMINLFGLADDDDDGDDGGKAVHRNIGIRCLPCCCCVQEMLEKT